MTANLSPTYPQQVQVAVPVSAHCFWRCPEGLFLGEGRGDTSRLSGSGAGRSLCSGFTEAPGRRVSVSRHQLANQSVPLKSLDP